MHPHSRPSLHLLWIALLVVALVVLFPISVRSDFVVAALALGL